VPRYRTKAPRSRKKGRSKKQKGGSLFIYLLLLIASGLAIWWIIKPVSPTTDETDDQGQVAKTEQTTDRRPGQATARTQDDQTRSKADEEGLDGAIWSAARKLGIPERSIRRTQRGNVTSFKLPLDPNTIDLTFANMIFKGEVERQNGTLVTGRERDRRQYLKFTDKDKKLTYNLELYFDASIYQTVVPDKVIAIVVDDFGKIGGELLRQFHQIDIEVCFAILPDEPNSVQTMQTAVGMGRESLIHVPMEPLGYPRVNPGENAIFVHLNEHEIQRRMERFISQMYLCKGINNHMGSFATADETTMQAVMNVIKEHDLYFLDSRTSNVSVAFSVAQRTGISTFRNDIFLDSPDLSAKTMEAKIKQCIEMAANRNYIIAITHCHTEEHLRFLQEFIRRIKAEGFVIVPLSKLGTYKLPSII